MDLFYNLSVTGFKALFYNNASLNYQSFKKGDDVMRFQGIKIMTVFFLSLALLTGCASSTIKGGGVGKLLNESNSAERMVIKTAFSSIHVQDITKAVNSVDEMLKQEKGLVVSSSVSHEGNASLVMRVPADRLEVVLDKLATLGQEEFRNIVTADVTEEVRDKENSLKNKLALRERLRQILDKAKTVQEIMAVEEQLTRLQTEIESLEQSLKKTKNDVEYSTINLTLNRQVILGPLGYVAYGLWWVVSKLFVLH